MAKPRNEATAVFRQFAWHLAGKLAQTRPRGRRDLAKPAPRPRGSAGSP